MATLQLLVPFLRLVLSSHRGYAFLIVLLRGCRAAIPVGLLWVGKLIVEAVELYYVDSASANWGYLAGLLGVELAIAVTGDVVNRLSSLFEESLGDLFANRMSLQLMRQGAQLDAAHFEDPQIYDRFVRAKERIDGSGLLSRCLGILQNCLTLISLVSVIVVYIPWLLVLLVLAVIPSFLGEVRFARLGYALFSKLVPGRRKLAYLMSIIINNKTFKEVKLFGLAPFLIDRYAELALQYYRMKKRLAIRRSVVAILFGAIAASGYYAAYGVIIYLTVIGYRSSAGVFTIGVLTFLAASFRQSRSLIQQVLLSVSDLYARSLYLQDLFALREMKASVTSRPDAIAIPRPLRSGIEFRGVGFRYPGASDWAVRNLSFVVPADRSVALVGENAAGKTTVVKLLTRLYDVQEGQILLDGVDLREYDLVDLRTNLGVIFQDFVRYSFSLRENIAVGEISRINDDDWIRRAARKGLAETLVDRMECGLEQMLGRDFEGGVELSGGEWQKVALARAYMRDAQILILDEPTAALDARAEYEVFMRFTELMKGRIGIVISHRFSTVRVADEVLVLHEGRIIEHGPHHDLIALGGMYAELFELQATSYS